jgi:hypothetical protein
MTNTFHIFHGLTTGCRFTHFKTLPQMQDAVFLRIDVRDLRRNRPDIALIIPNTNDQFII